MTAKILWQEQCRGRVKSRMVSGVLQVTAFGANGALPPPPSPPTPTHYVSPQGNDARSGKSPTEAWRTIDKANRTLSAGDCLAIAAGKYNEVIRPSNSGTSSKPIWYTAQGHGDVIIAGNGAEELALVESKDHIHLHGLLFKHDTRFGASAAHWVRYQNAKGGLIYNCKMIQEGDLLDLFSRYKAVGISLKDCHNMRVQGNYLRGLKHGMYFEGDTRKLIVYDNHVREMWQHGLAFGKGNEDVFQGTIVWNNLIELVYADGIQLVNPISGDTTDPSQCFRGIIIRGNIFRHCFENAIDYKATRHLVIENNVFYGIRGVGDYPDQVLGKSKSETYSQFALFTLTRGSRTTVNEVIVRRNLFFDTPQPTVFSGGQGNDAQGIKVYNNTIVGPNRNYFGGDRHETGQANITKRELGHRQQGGNRGVRCAFVNNIVVGANTAAVGLLFNSGADQYYDHNLYYNSNSPGVRFARIDTNTDWTLRTFSQWKADMEEVSRISGKEAHSLADDDNGTDPLFVKGKERPEFERDVDDRKVQRVGDLRAYLDYRLRAKSPAIDAGGSLARATNDGSNSTKLEVDDAAWFMDGFGIVDGDLIRIGPNAAVEIKSVDYDRNQITLKKAQSWTSGTPVFLNYNGAAPDIGYWESGYA